MSAYISGTSALKEEKKVISFPATKEQDSEQPKKKKGNYKEGEKQEVYPFRTEEDLQKMHNYFVEKKMSENLRFWGRRTVKAFGVTSRFVHLEFFRLNRAHRGLGEVGDFVALEVNMRPGGGFTPDMINYAHSISMFKIWADMVTFDRRTTGQDGVDRYCLFTGRRNNVEYVLSREEVLRRYGSAIKENPNIAPALAPAMGDYAFIAVFDEKEQLDAFKAAVTERR